MRIFLIMQVLTNDIEGISESFYLLIIFRDGLTTFLKGV